MGKKGKLLDYQTISRIKKLYEAGSSMREIKEETGISLGTIFKYLQADKVQLVTKENLNLPTKQLEQIQKEIEHIKNRIKQLEQQNYSPMVRNQKEQKTEVKPIRTQTVEGTAWIKTDELREHIYNLEGKPPSRDVIQRSFRDWKKHTGNSTESNSHYGYPLDTILKALQYYNETKEDRYKLDISELENGE